VEGRLYLFGGWEDDDNDSEASELWDPKSEEWIPMPRLPPQVACRIWEVAGIQAKQLSICTQTPQSSRTSPARLTKILPRYCAQTKGCAWRFDHNNNEWDQLRPLLASRAEAAVGVLDGHIYLLGGMDDQSEVIASCERYDLLTDEWERFPSLRCPRAWAAAGVLGGMLYICGGFGEDGRPLDTAESFNPVTGAWEFAELSSLREACSGFEVASLPKCASEDDSEMVPAGFAIGRPRRIA